MRAEYFVAAIWLAAPSAADTIDFRCELPEHALSVGSTSLEAESFAYRVRYSVNVLSDHEQQVRTLGLDKLELNPVTDEYVVFTDHHFGTCCESSDEFFNVEFVFGGAIAHLEIKQLHTIYNLDFKQGTAQYSVAGGVTFHPEAESSTGFVSADSSEYPTFETYLRRGSCKFTPIDDPLVLAREKFALESAEKPTFCDTIRGVIKNTDQLPESSKRHPCFRDE